jgi:hypothetical protein
MCPFPLQDVDLDAEFLKRIFEPYVEKPRKGSLAKIGLQIDWTRYARQLQTGDLSGLARRLAKRVRAAGAHPEVALLASRLGLEPIRLAIALIACALPVTSRSALRVARAIFGGPVPREAEDLARGLRLSKW